ARQRRHRRGLPARSPGDRYAASSRLTEFRGRRTGSSPRVVPRADPGVPTPHSGAGCPAARRFRVVAAGGMGRLPGLGSPLGPAFAPRPGRRRGAGRLGGPALVQVWGLRYAAYVVPSGEHAYFTVSRLPERGPLRERADDIAARLADFVGDHRVDAREAAAGIGIHPNAIRYAAPTGALLIRWDGARQPTVWFVPRPEIEPFDARFELARRYLRMLGPGTPAGFSQWAGIRMPRVRPVFEALRTSLVPVRIPGGEAFLLEEDVDSARSESEPAPARLLPSGDVFYLVHGPARAVVVPDPEHRAALWPSRVWPGAVLVE